MTFFPSKTNLLQAPTLRLLFLFYWIPLFVFAQDKFTISGTITDSASNETLIGVSILFPAVRKGVVTNEYGFYSITLPAGSYKMQVSYLGFRDVFKTIQLSQNTTLDFDLEAASEMLEEVVIKENIERVNIKTPQMSVNQLKAGTIKEIPVVLGEADVVKSIVLLPGVTSGGEGASGFNVRGGSADQNLILLDEATIFNSSHLFGFFSVFNPDAIKDLKLFKGGIPAKYGGRVSSVLDIYQKEGNSKNYKLTGGIGAVASRLLVEGPISKDKSAFLAGGRASYAHLFLPLIDNPNIAYFYDLNLKLNYRINASNSLFLSGYFGRDVFEISENFNNLYGNAVINLRWNHLFSNKLFSNLSIIYSDYFYGLELNFVGFEWNSGIRNVNLKYDFKHYLSDRIQLNYGLNSIYFRFNPGEIKPNSAESGIIPEQLIQKYANESAVYLDAEHRITDALNLQYGFRVSSFIRFGQEAQFVYQDNNPLEFNAVLQIYQSAEPIGIESFDRSDRIRTFVNLEPRFSLAYAFDSSSSIKTSYNRMTQYLHLISNTNSPTPLDVWAPSGKFITPQILNQYAVGYFKRFMDGQYSFETEYFYKDIRNRIDYIDGADLIANNAIEQEILNGEARAYGLEILFRKNEGKLKGWLAYTASRSEQRTPGRTPTETGINNGDWYRTPFDKTHDISCNGSYTWNPKWKIAANFVFQTGQPTNYPTGQFNFQGLSVPVFENPRNGERLPAYHRLDLSAIYTPQKNKKWKGEWVFSIYNAYNRLNAASIAFARNDDTLKNEALRTSIFGIVPSVTYNFRF